MASSLKEAVSSLKKKISGTFPKALKEEIGVVNQGLVDKFLADGFQSGTDPKNVSKSFFPSQEKKTTERMTLDCEVSIGVYRDLFPYRLFF